MGSIENRLRRLEEGAHGGRCSECGLPPDGHGHIAVVYEDEPERGFDGDPDERCGRCGRLLYTVVQVRYGDGGAGEGGGGGR